MLAAILCLVLAAATPLRVNAAELSYQSLMSAVVQCIDLRDILKTYECTKVVEASGTRVPPHCKCFLACVGQEMNMLTAEGAVDVAGALQVVDLDSSADALDVADDWKQCDTVSNLVNRCDKAYETLLCLWGKDSFIPRYSDDRDTLRFIKMLTQHSRRGSSIWTVEGVDMYEEVE